MTRYAQRTLIQQGTVANWGKAASSIGVVQGYGTATGGTGVLAGPSGYNYTSFTSSGTLTITAAGLFDILIFGGELRIQLKHKFLTHFKSIVSQSASKNKKRI